MALPGKALAPYQGRAAGQAEGARGRQLQALAFRLRLEQCKGCPDDHQGVHSQRVDRGGEA